MRVKYLDFWQNTELATDEQDFTIHVTAFDNTTDRRGEIRYDFYPIARLKFKDGVVCESEEIQRGHIALPNFSGWNKKMLRHWLDEVEEMRGRMFGRYEEYEIYHSVIVLE